MKTQEFDFDTKSRVMPHDPVELRGKTRESGRMIVLDRATSEIEHSIFLSICDYFRSGDLLVLNDSYMLSNTLWCEGATSGGSKTQVTVYGLESDGITIVKINPEQLPHVKAGLTLTSTDDSRLTCHFLEPQPDQLWKTKFSPYDLLMPTLDQYGERLDEEIHLNPTHWKSTPQAYRSVYAKAPGSLEIPSAGLHFSRELLSQATAKGVELAFLTLHVGATEMFSVRHISAEEIEKHKVKSEYYEVSEKTTSQINRARADGRRVIAVGTTVMRTLETLTLDEPPRGSTSSTSSRQKNGEEKEAANGNGSSAEQHNGNGAAVEPTTTKRGMIKAHGGWTDLYIYPGFDFKIVDVLLTNLHRPRSSHIVLTAAFAGKDFVMRSYDEIAERGGYEFDMFGDSMLIV